MYHLSSVSTACGEMGGLWKVSGCNLFTTQRRNVPWLVLKMYEARNFRSYTLVSRDGCVDIVNRSMSSDCFEELYYFCLKLDELSAELLK